LFYLGDGDSGGEPIIRGYRIKLPEGEGYHPPDGKKIRSKDTCIGQYDFENKGKGSFRWQEKGKDINGS